MAAHRLSADTKQLLASSRKRDQTALPCLCLSEAQNLCFGCGVPYHRARDIFVPWSLVTWKVRCQNAITQQMQCCSSLWACRRSIITEDAKLLCEARFLRQPFALLTRSKATNSSIIRNSLYRTVGPYFLGPRNFAALLTQEGCRRNWPPVSPLDAFSKQSFE